MPRRKEVGSRADRKEKKERQARTKEGLIALHEQLIQKIESGAFPRDEEIRFLKRFGELLAVAEARETRLEKKEETLPEGRLREFIERAWKIKEECGITSKEDYVRILKQGGYVTCSYCNYQHLKDAKCPFEELARERKSKEVAESN